MSVHTLPPLVGVKPLWATFPLVDLKRSSLLFDHIIVPNLHTIWPRLNYPGEQAFKEDGWPRGMSSEVKFLRDRRFLRFTTPETLFHEDELDRLLHVGTAVQLYPEPRHVEGDSDDTHAHNWSDLIARAVSVKIQNSEGVDATPILTASPAVERVWAKAVQQGIAATPTAINSALEQAVGMTISTHFSHVLRVVLEAMPQPHESTPWEDILEFRNDTDAREQALALRRWMRKIAKAEAPPNEVAEELASLIAEYERHMRLHRMKISKGVLETIVTVAGEVAEDLIKVKWSKLAKVPFVLKQRNIELLEAESKAPGREVAFVASARRRFTNWPVEPAVNHTLFGLKRWFRNTFNDPKTHPS